MSLFVGTNYHPHDWKCERWITDIDLMKKAGFTTVRLGHLCWDSYEPEEGVYTFEWFDEVMDLFAEANIGVVLDISMRPAPVWVHNLCPGCAIYNKNGAYQESITRYMEDLADPAYQHYALRFAEKIVTRYKNHPALFAWGLCNEIGAGFPSYSVYAKRRFIQWLKKKYGTVETLNKAWSSQRWGRKLTSFDEVYFQENDLALGSPEAWLDMRRFFSDGNGEFLCRLKEQTYRLAPNIPSSSNHYAEKESFGFDYFKYYGDFADYPGMGYYPEYHIDERYYRFSYYYHYRLAETNKPMWCLEFQSGRHGMISGPSGILRMHAFLCLLNRTQMILAWTWRSMLAGEEQYLYGLLGHDGVPNANYEEYCRIAKDMKKLEKYAFPYVPDPDVAVACSYDNMLLNQRSGKQYRQSYMDGMLQIMKLFFAQNRDFNMVSLEDIKNTYKLILIPNHIVMTPSMAEHIREFVKKGGYVIMTGYSATTDEHGSVFETPRPGLLNDVFGIRIAGFYRTDMPWTFSEHSLRYTDKDGEREQLLIGIDQEEKWISADYYEDIQLKQAESYASFKQKDMCAVSVNSYGKGKAFYMAAETNEKLLEWLIEKLESELNLNPALKVPAGIQAREIAENQVFYVNTSDSAVNIPISYTGKRVLTDEIVSGNLKLKPYEAELVLKEWG